MNPSSERWKNWYRALRDANPDMYHKAIRCADGLAINYNLDTNLAAEIEVAMVMLVCEALDIRPPNKECQYCYEWCLPESLDEGLCPQCAADAREYDDRAHRDPALGAGYGERRNGC